MTCPGCGAATQPGQRFCAQCGTRLERACSGCGGALPAEARFCPACGTAVPEASPHASAGASANPDADMARTAVASPAPQAERRLVSVLFCDLVGFTAASEDRDAEQTRELLTTYYELARERVERYGGTIEKFIGDAVMAVWGVPVAHEDDAERAVRAALDLVSAVAQVDERLAGRAAVVSGEAAVTLGAEGQGMVAGDLVNTASRLQGYAPAGGVLVSDATRAATEQAVIYERLEPAKLKGKAEAVEVWRALRARAGIGGRFASDELEPPFVGRDAELRMLTEMFHATAREGRLRLVSVTGQAGIGKSRLSRELESYLDGISQTVYWHRGRCPAYGEGLTYWALGEMVRRRAGIAETDDPEAAAAKISAALDEFVPDAAERARVEPALRALIGLETRGWAATETGELFAAWRTFFERIAEEAPVVLVFEDMQWADAGLVSFIGHLLEWSRTQPILVVTLARPEFLEAHPTWGAGLRNFSNLHLEPLPDDAIVEMLDGVVRGLPASASRRIAARAEGVPLYAVETLRMLLAQGVLARDPEHGGVSLVGELTDVAVPESLRGLVAARLDLLPPDERPLVQDAAVLGQTFTAEALAAVAGVEAGTLEAPLRELVRRELLRLESDPRSPERGQYQWVQAVLREVAYATLAKRDRRSRHLAAARYFDVTGGEESAGVVADHYLEAWRASAEPPEAAALAGQARVALRAAAERAERLRNYVQAASFVAHGLELTDDPVERVAMLERSGDLLSHGGASLKAEARYREALAAMPTDADPDDLARLTAKIGREIIQELRMDEAIGLLEEAVARFGPDLDGPGRVELEGQLGRAYFLVWRPDDAEATLRRTIEAAERVGPTEALIEAIVSLGSSGLFGSHLSGIAMLLGSVELARLLGLPRAELRALNNTGAWWYTFDPKYSQVLNERTLELCARSGYSPVSWLISTVDEVALGQGMEAAWARVAELADRVEPGSREDEDLVSMMLDLALWSGDWERWNELDADLTARPARSAEAASFRRLNTGFALLVQGRDREGVEILATLAGRQQRVLVLAGLLVADPAMVRSGLERMSGPASALGTIEPGLRAVGEAGLRLLDGVSGPDVDAYLDGVEGLARGESIELWTLSMMALIRVAGTDHPGVGDAETALRERLMAVGATGFIGALDRELARAGAVEAEAADRSATVAPSTPPSRPASVAADA